METSHEPWGGFPEGVQEDVDGLLWLGYLEDEFEWCGHMFTIRTLRGDEELNAALVCKEYTETVGQAKANIWSQIALALVAIDGDEDFCPPAGPDRKGYARARFQYATSKWFWPTAIAIFSRYSALLERQANAIKALEDLFDGSLPMPTPSAGSSKDRASSEDPPPEEDIRELLDD